MSLKNLRKAVKISKRFYETEASGGITLKNVRRIAATGVNRVSIGQITHSAPIVDFKINFIRLSSKLSLCCCKSRNRNSKW